ncbi:MAG: hypothetical protein JSR33_07455 [Proteobacteria bacterium]|nr:hypothetical protein [Pseudomonadota bacterium]
MQEEQSELPKRPHKIYSAEVRREHLNAWQDSGLSMSEYCRRHPLGISILSKWALESGISTKVKLKPLKMPSPSLSISNISPLEIRLPNGIQIRIGQRGDGPVKKCFEGNEN